MCQFSQAVALNRMRITIQKKNTDARNSVSSSILMFNIGFFLLMILCCRPSSNVIHFNLNNPRPHFPISQNDRSSLKHCSVSMASFFHIHNKRCKNLTIYNLNFLLLTSNLLKLWMNLCLVSIFGFTVDTRISDLYCSTS
jgi:hypothetical protein